MKTITVETGQLYTVAMNDSDEIVGWWLKPFEDAVKEAESLGLKPNTRVSPEHWWEATGRESVSVGFIDVEYAMHTDIVRPFIAVEYDNASIIIDGHHRLYRAYMEGVEWRYGYLFPKEQAARWQFSPKDARRVHFGEPTTIKFPHIGVTLYVRGT